MTAMRSQLATHESNPRTIDQHAYKKLKEYLKKNRLLNALVVNRRSAANGFPPEQEGRLVIIGGHQRTRAMDELIGFNPDAPTPETDYEVPIDVVCVGPGREKEILVALNNPSLQGTYDLDMLAEILSDPEVDPFQTGYDRAELATILDVGVVEQIMGGAIAQQITAEAPIVDAMNDIAAVSKQAQQAQRAADPAPGAHPAAGSPIAHPVAGSPAAVTAAEAAAPAAGSDRLDPNSVEALRLRRQVYQAGVNTSENQASFYVVLVADRDEDIVSLLTHLKLPEDQRYYPLRDFLSRIGFDFDFDADPMGNGSDAAAG